MILIAVNIYWQSSFHHCATPVHAFQNILFITLGPCEISLLCPFHRWRNQDPRCEIMSPMSPIRIQASKPLSGSRMYVLNNCCIWPSQISFLNWRIIALQCCVGLCHTSTWISHWYFKVATKNKHVPKSNQHHSLKMVGMKHGFLETRAGRYLGKGVREAFETFAVL